MRRAKSTKLQKVTLKANLEEGWPREKVTVICSQKGGEVLLCIDADGELIEITPDQIEEKGQA